VSRTASTKSSWLGFQEEGQVFPSGTRIDGVVYLRAAILSFRTHLQHVEEAVECLVRGVRTAEGRHRSDMSAAT
jgi:hypothetical protein